MQTELLESLFNATLCTRSGGTLGGLVQCFLKELCIWIMWMATTDKRLVLLCFYKQRELSNLVYVKRAGKVWELSPKIIYLRGKRERTKCSEEHIFSLSHCFCLTLWARVHLHKDRRADAVSRDTCLEAPRKVTICNINSRAHFE